MNLVDAQATDQPRRERIVTAYIDNIPDIDYANNLRLANELSPIRAFIRASLGFRWWDRPGEGHSIYVHSIYTDEEVIGDLPKFEDGAWVAGVTFMEWAISDEHGWPVFEKFINYFTQAGYPPLPWLVEALAEEVTA